MRWRCFGQNSRVGLSDIRSSELIQTKSVVRAKHISAHARLLEVRAVEGLQKRRMCLEKNREFSANIGTGFRSRRPIAHDLPRSAKLRETQEIFERRVA